MVIILPTEDIDVQRYSGCHRKRVEYVREHFTGEVPYLFSLDAQICYAVWARAYVYYCSR